MKAVQAKLLEFLDKSPQFIIPIYQRMYSWTEKECNQLWNDILRAGLNDNVSAHFIGSIVYVEQDMYQVSNRSPLLVIDGQQRLATLTLILEALARRVGDDEPFDGFSSRKIHNYYLLNDLEDDERRFKLLLTQTDKASLMALVQNRPLPDNVSKRVAENFSLIVERISELGDNLAAFCKGLAKLVIVDISLSRGQDNPQLIFESMNSMGKELSQADLIRNFILMGLEPEHQTRLYVDHWHPMECAFGQDAYIRHFDSFMRHFLTLKTGEIPKVRDVYETFKEYSGRPDVDALGLDELVADIHQCADDYCAMALGKELDISLGNAFRELRELEANVAFPFLLGLYQDYRSGVLLKDDFLQVVQLVESYVFRRSVCSLATNSLNNTFASFAKSVRKDRYLESVAAHFMLLPSYRRFPLDDEFMREIRVRNLYKFQRCSYYLRRLENYERKERVDVNEYSVEHILPQNEDLSAEWQDALGPNWKEVQSRYLHTLGNLTLTGYNSEYSDKTFQQKRDMKGGFRESPLHLNRGLGDMTAWNAGAIETRATWLSEKCRSVWVAPALSAEQLETYSVKEHVRTKYSLQDHPHLVANPEIKALFEQFRKEVLALDTCVTEEFLKLYVAYKAETNFVDVVPQAKRLRLSVNLDFHEIDDPRGMAVDVTNLGRWGNGDVEVGLSNEDELPYVLGLVRQAFEKQMGEGD